MTPGRSAPLMDAPSTTRLMIVDDHPAIREGLALRIANVPDMVLCGEAEDC